MSAPRPPTDLTNPIIGRALHALRAYVKALSLQSQGESFTYKISPDKSRAQIVNSKNESQYDKPISQWAREGSQIRLAFIGLKYAKDKIELGLNRDVNQTNSLVVYYLNAIDGIACLRLSIANAEAVNVTFAQVIEFVRRSYSNSALADEDVVLKVLLQLANDNSGIISTWAMVGRQVEIQVFESLQAAEGCADANIAALERQRAYMLGVIRRPKPTSNQNLFATMEKNQ